MCEDRKQDTVSKDKRWIGIAAHNSPRGGIDAQKRSERSRNADWAGDADGPIIPQLFDPGAAC
jgi:hypothetical protein